MKKCYSLLHWPCLLQDVLSRRFCSKPLAAVAPKYHHHFFVSELSRKKTVDAAKILAAQKIFIETQQTFVNGLLGFITLGIYTPLERVIAHNNCMVPSIWATLYALLINILLGSFSCFCIVISLSLRVK